MSRRWSLRGRLVKRLLLGVSLGWLVALGVAIFVISHEMTELLDETLRQSAHVALAIYDAAEGVADLDLGEGSAIRIQRGGAEIHGAPWPVQAADGAHEVAGWRVLRLSQPGGGLVVEVGQSNEWRLEELWESIEALLILMLPVLGVVLLTVRHSVAAALAPALQFADRLRGRRASDLSAVESQDLPVELEPIPQALNSYLKRIEHYIEAERQFTTNAAHELRTPLATASAQAQLIAAGMADAGAPGRMVRAIDRLGSITERLLQLSRAEAGLEGGASCDLVRVVRMVAAEHPANPPLFDDGDIEAARINMHPDAAALIIGNVVRNAYEHGTGRVSLVLRPGPVLTIRNPVAAGAEFRHDTFTKSATSKGVGLGLTIIQKVAERSGIGLEFAVRQKGPQAEATVRMDFSTCTAPG